VGTRSDLLVTRRKPVRQTIGEVFISTTPNKVKKSRHSPCKVFFLPPCSMEIHFDLTFCQAGGKSHHGLCISKRDGRFVSENLCTGKLREDQLLPVS